jgi:hypothetical protein
MRKSPDCALIGSYPGRAKIRADSMVASYMDAEEFTLPDIGGGYLAMW